MIVKKEIHNVKNKLLENARLSIILGIDDYQLSKDNPSRKISSIRNVFSGILLLYKYKLILRSPDNKPYLYISSNSKKDKKEEGFGCKIPKNTVNIQEIKDNFRKLKICVDWEVLDKTQKLRNNLEHFYDTNDTNILELLVESFYLIKSFYDNYLCSSIGKDLKKFLGDDVYNCFLDNEKIYNDLLTESRQSFDKVNFPYNLKDWIITSMACTYCSSNLVKYDNGDYPNLIMSCLLCSKGENLEKEYFLGLTHKDIRHTGDFRQECPRCNNYSFLDDIICLECGFKSDPKVDYDRENYLRYLMDKDD